MANEVIEQGVAAVTGAMQGRVFPRTALVLGSGLGPFADRLTEPHDIAYADIPGFPIPTVSGHAGRLRIGKAAGHALACLQGRFHAYEGHPAAALAVPVRILKRLGVERLILTNAAGSIRADKPAGSLMVLTDHINFSGQNPLIGPNDESFGPRFFDTSHAYDDQLRARLHAAAKAEGVEVYDEGCGPVRDYQPRGRARARRTHPLRHPGRGPEGAGSGRKATASLFCSVGALGNPAMSCRGNLDSAVFVSLPRNELCFYGLILLHYCRA